ncbi:MFS transporter [Croceicoccus hydrothermalis]|uniref:MFS transporter n=1 Tax=Croceicoccus hydrothermalis TaxID=2867964 RepID=UPI001EFAB8D2|nr:MFS transporter [Croceicoccus hydrothermalis]
MPEKAAGDGTAPAPRHPYQIRDYRLFWICRFSGVIATLSMVVVLGWQVYDVARSDYGMSRSVAAFQLGILGLVQFVPLFVLTPVAGLAADRFDRRRVAALSMGIDMLVAAGLGLATWFDILSLPLLFALAALHGVARIFLGPALNSLAPNIVPAAMIPRAIAMNSIAWQFASVLGPAAGGLLYAIFPTLPYIVSVGLLALGASLVLMIKPLRKPDIDRTVHPWRQVRDGLRFVWNDRFLLGAISLDLFAVLLGGVTALLPVFARDILRVGPEGLGWMRAAPAVGAGIVALWLSVRPMERNVGVKMLWAVGAYGLATAIFGFSRSLAFSLVLLVGLGAADMISVFVRSSLVQLNTPDAMRGRVSSISGLAISASNELGELQSGIAAALLGATGAVIFGGAGAVLVTLIWAMAFPELKNARTFAPAYRE